MADVKCWLSGSLARVYPATPAGSQRSLNLLCARNESAAFQVCVRNEAVDHEAKVAVWAEVPEALDAQVRRVGYVAQRHLNTATPEDHLEGIGHIPGFVPDPLFPENTTVLGPRETQSFWVTVRIPSDSPVGRHDVRLKVLIGEKTTRTLTARLDVRELMVADATEFLVGHWFYADALCDHYHVQPYDASFWEIVKPYMADYMGHGNNVMFVPHLTPPINGEHRPSQLLRVNESGGKFTFDFSDVCRWIHIARSFGATHFLWSHLFTQWGASRAVSVYRSNADPQSLLWPKEESATSSRYRGFLKAYLPALRRFMESEGVADTSFIHISDEPHTDEHRENYRKAQAMAREIAPWIVTMDGLSDVRFNLEGLCNFPISGLGAAEEFRGKGIPHCVYYCCGPRGTWLNRLMDTPLAKIRMSGWLFHKMGAAGFMHWGYNYWYRGCTDQLLDPFTEQAYGEWPFIPYGDPFVVYPGQDGPLDSIRWEVFAESLRDLALLRTAGVKPDDPLLKDIRSYETFPFSAQWIQKTRRKILTTSG